MKLKVITPTGVLAPCSQVIWVTCVLLAFGLDFIAVLTVTTVLQGFSALLTVGSTIEVEVHVEL